MYATTTYQAPSDAQLLCQFAARCLLRVLAALVLVAVLVSWVPQLRPYACERTQLLGLPTVCVAERPVGAVLAVTGLDSGQTVVTAGKATVSGVGGAAVSAHNGLVAEGAGPSARVREATDGMGAVNDALSGSLTP